MGDLYPLIYSIVCRDNRKQLQIEDAKTIEEFHENDSHLRNLPERNLAKAVGGSNTNNGPVGWLRDPSRKIQPSLKSKCPFKESDIFLLDSELSREVF